MPKAKPRHRKDRTAIISRYDVMSDDDSANDNASSASSMSSSGIFEDTNFAEEIPDEGLNDEAFEDKLAEAIDGLTEKCAQDRANAIEAVCGALTKRFVPELVEKSRFTLTDAIERSLKKGRTNEQAAAAQLAVLLCLQLGSTNVVDEICHTLIPNLILMVSDRSTSTVARAKCCWSLGLLTFMGGYEESDAVMRYLADIFSAVSFVNDANLSTDQAGLCAAALTAWCLLLTVATNANAMFETCWERVVRLLDANSVEVRMAAGETIAVILERRRRYVDVDVVSDDDEEANMTDVALTEKLKALATDAHKFRAKKERKTQRSAFRDILRYVEDHESPKVQVRFGQECLSLNSWCRKKQYDAFCQALGSGMNLHLKENDLIRDVLNLGEKLTSLTSMAAKQSKMERHMMNAAAFKARSIYRGRNRDKRIVSLC